MNRKYRFLAALLSLSLSIFVKGSVAQTEPAEVTPEKLAPEWQLSASVSPIVLHMLGSQNEDVFLLGVHAKRISDRHAWRIGMEGSPSDYSLSHHGFTVVGVTDEKVAYLAVGGKSQKVRGSIGYERGRQTGWGRVYVGADITGYFEREDLQAKRFLDDPTDDQIEFDGFENGTSYATRTSGGGIKPVSGFAFDITESFGLIAEFKYDMLLTFSKGYTVDDNAKIEAQGNVVTFSTLPLLDIRLSYTF